MSALGASVTAGKFGPVVTLAGEADMTNIAELDELITAQLSDGSRCLTIDASALRFMDSVATRVLLHASRTMRQRGGDLVLLRPQYNLVRILALLGATHLVTIDGETDTVPDTAR